MAKSKGSKRVTVKSKGSRAKKRSRIRTGVLDARNWKTSTIAWNRDGNIVILDPRVARLVRKKAREDREIEIGIPAVPIDDGTAPPKKLVGGGVTPPLPPLMICVCNAMSFDLAQETLVRHSPLTSPSAH